MSNSSKMDKNKISFLAAVVIGVNAMIGAGVLAIPTVLSAKVGPAGILSTIFSVIFVLCIGLSLGRVADIFPGKGWNYLYTSKWAGHGDR